MTCASNGKEQASIPSMSLGSTCKPLREMGAWIQPVKSHEVLSWSPKLHKQRSHFPPKRV